MTLRSTFAQACREARLGLDISQQQVADSIGVSRGYVANIEAGRANPSLTQAERIAGSLGMHVELRVRPPTILGTRRAGGDVVHARCSGYVDRRVRRAGWSTAREVEIVEGRSHGWIDLLAFDPRTHRLLVIELKTRLDDIGAVERQLAWYERRAPIAAAIRGWRVRMVFAWLLVLASDDIDGAVRVHRDVLDHAFPVRAPQMTGILGGDVSMPGSEPGPGLPGVAGGARRLTAVPGPGEGRGLAMIDPSSRRSGWLIRTRSDGRRTPAPYRSYADAATALGPTRRR